MDKPRRKAEALTTEQKRKEKEIFKKRLANVIKKARTSRGYKQEDVASLAGLDLSYIGHLERGVYIPTSYVLWKIAKALEIKLSTLVRDL